MKNLDSLFLDVLLGKTAEHRDPSRWNIPLIHNPQRTLTKRDVFNYYSQPQIRAAILSQTQNSPTIVVQKFEGEPVLRRLGDRKEPIRITKDAGDVDDPSDYQYWIERRAIEFHPTLSEKTRQVFVDIDPKEGFPWKNTKRLTRAVYDHMDKHPDVMSTEIRYSGGDGFHVVGQLAKDVHVDDARSLARSIINPVLGKHPKATLLEAKPGEVRLDITTLKQAGSLRGLYSLNKDTGLVCIPVEEEHLDDFTPEQATIQAVVGGRLRNTTSLRP